MLAILDPCLSPKVNEVLCHGLDIVDLELSEPLMNNSNIFFISLHGLLICIMNLVIILSPDPELCSVFQYFSNWLLYLNVISIVI